MGLPPPLRSKPSHALSAGGVARADKAENTCSTSVESERPKSMTWEKVGNLSGDRDKYWEEWAFKSKMGPFKSRKGSGYEVRKAKDGPSTVSINDLLDNEYCAEAVLELLGNTRVGTVTERVPEDRRYLVSSFICPFRCPVCLFCCSVSPLSDYRGRISQEWHE